MSDEFLRLSVTEAAIRFGVSVDTIRRRIKTRDIQAERDPSGKWWVWLAADSEPAVVRAVASRGTAARPAAREPVAAAPVDGGTVPLPSPPSRPVPDPGVPPSPVAAASVPAALAQTTPDHGPSPELTRFLLAENERLWEAVRRKDELVHDLMDRLGAAATALALFDRTQSERDEARDQLKLLKQLVMQVIARVHRVHSAADHAESLDHDHAGRSHPPGDHRRMVMDDRRDDRDSPPIAEREAPALSDRWPDRAAVPPPPGIAGDTSPAADSGTLAADDDNVLVDDEWFTPPAADDWAQPPESRSDGFDPADGTPPEAGVDADAEDRQDGSDLDADADNGDGTPETDTPDASNEDLVAAAPDDETAVDEPPVAQAGPEA